MRGKINYASRQKIYEAIMEDKIFNEIKNISNRVDKNLHEMRQQQERSAKRNPRATKQVTRPVKKVTRPTNNGPKPVVQAPRSANLLKPRSKSFFDLVEKSRALDREIKQSRKDGKDAKERLQALEEFSKISEEMENID